MEEGGLSGAIFNAAKERALDLFIDRQIGFLDMARVVERTMDAISPRQGLQNDIPDLDTIRDADKEARHVASQMTEQLG